MILLLVSVNQAVTLVDCLGQQPLFAYLHLTVMVNGTGMEIGITTVYLHDFILYLFF